MDGQGKSRQELADRYGICRRTFNKWLREEGLSLPKGLITPKDQELIYSKLGTPPKIFKSKSSDKH